MANIVASSVPRRNRRRVGGCFGLRAENACSTPRHKALRPPIAPPGWSSRRTTRSRPLQVADEIPAATEGPRAFIYGSRALPHLRSKPHLDQRLIGHVALVGGDLDRLQQADGKPDRNRGRARLQGRRTRSARRQSRAAVESSRSRWARSRAWLPSFPGALRAFVMNGPFPNPTRASSHSPPPLAIGAGAGHALREPISHIRPSP